MSACAVIFPDRTAPKSASYNINKLNTPWTKIPVGEDPNSVDALKADIAYENPKTGAVISLNSLCRKYNSTSLEQLTLNLVRGINDREQISQKQISLNGADALDSIFLGNVDGVEIHIRTVVLVKNFCTYDFIHVIVPKHEADKADASFDNFLNSFRTQ